MKISEAREGASSELLAGRGWPQVQGHSEQVLWTFYDWPQLRHTRYLSLSLGSCGLRGRWRLLGLKGFHLRAHMHHPRGPQWQRWVARQSTGKGERSFRCWTFIARRKYTKRRVAARSPGTRWLFGILRQSPPTNWAFASCVNFFKIFDFWWQYEVKCAIFNPQKTWVSFVLSVPK